VRRARAAVPQAHPRPAWRQADVITKGGGSAIEPGLASDPCQPGSLGPSAFLARRAGFGASRPALSPPDTTKRVTLRGTVRLRDAPDAPQWTGLSALRLSDRDVPLRRPRRTVCLGDALYLSLRSIELQDQLGTIEDGAVLVEHVAP
jgi:hypothetical protein